jgi:F0F1-type ATP synthase assembly protein I
MPENNRDREAKRRQFQQLLDASSIGWMFPIAIGLGYLWGWGMDKLFGTTPWLTWIFTAFGMIAAFINLFRIGLGDSGSNG